MSNLRFFPALAVVLAQFVPSTALACWDGFYARVGNVDEMGGDTTWDETTLKHHALWLGRVNALVPKDATVTSEHGFVMLTVGGKSHEFTWQDGNYRTLFDTVAHDVGASTNDIDRALRMETRVYVVQAGAFVNESRARSWAETLSQGDEAEHGFFEVGGFPADNPEAHVVTISGAKTLHRVYVGAFVHRSEAENLAKRLGRGAFVRELM